MKKVKEINIINPEFIYVPYEKGTEKKNDSKVYLEEILGMRKEKYVYSTVSGLYVSDCEVYTSLGSINAKIIENDFMDKRKEPSSSKKSLYALKKEEIISSLSKYNITIPKNLNVNIYYKKNYSSESLLFEEKAEELLELLDVINTTLKSEVNIFVNSSDQKALEFLDKYSNSYPNLNILYDKTISEKIEVLDLVKIYHIIKSNRLINYKYVTILGKNLELNVKVKLYTKVLDLINILNLEEFKNISIIDINGKSYFSEEAIIDENVVGITLK